ncbi:hypothetical protein C8R44DRAFT_728407 [Mycena epipterygia]|nr:hypothetical protein C8R44DRAFT_728407 [Mycena epipterygia]
MTRTGAALTWHFWNLPPIFLDFIQHSNPLQELSGSFETSGRTPRFASCCASATLPATSMRAGTASMRTSTAPPLEITDTAAIIESSKSLEKRECDTLRTERSTDLLRLEFVDIQNQQHEFYFNTPPFCVGIGLNTLYIFLWSGEQQCEKDMNYVLGILVILER